MVTDEVLCTPILSVAVKLITNEPNWLAAGVQEKLVVTGFPLVGKLGELVAPGGNPTAESVTIFP
jgi:hypothetical protein